MTKDTPEVSIHELTSCGCSRCKEEVMPKTQPSKSSQPSAGALRAARHFIALGLLTTPIHAADIIDRETGRARKRQSRAMKEKTLLSIKVLPISTCDAHNLRRSQAGKDFITNALPLDSDKTF